MPNLVPPTPIRRSLGAAALAVLLASTALGGFALVGHAADPTTSTTTPATTATTDTGSASRAVNPVPIPPSNPLPNFVDLVARVSPAVVQITNDMKPTQADAEGQPQQPFGMPMPFGMMPQQQEPHAVEALGSGFLIDANGTIVTNNHVVKDARTLTVTLSDGTQLPAKVIGTDPRTDLAVLRVHADHKLPFIQLGDSAKVRPGEWVLAIGSPFGLGGSVTAGIVSSTGRDIGEGPYDNFIQVDAPINRGNSGGPLFTQDGRVVGVNTAILSPSGGSVGIGFAIPSDMVRQVVAELEKDGHITRGYLGVETQTVSEEMRKALRLPSEKSAGALVASVEPDSPASKAGLQPGDVIVSVNGTAIGSPRDLALDIANIKPGADTKIGVLRDGSEQTVTADIATLKTSATASSGEEGGQPAIGLALAPLTPDARQQFDVPARTKGAVVAEVTPGSAADQAGLRAGDVLVGVGAKAVTSPEDAVRAIRAARQGGDPVALRVWRDGHTAFVAVQPPTGNQKGTDSDQG
jgi:serine protease Do